MIIQAERSAGYPISPGENGENIEVVERYPLSLGTLALKIHPSLPPSDERILRRIEEIDWKNESWDIDNSYHRLAAARAVSTGIPVFHDFGNFKALTFHPHLESMRTVNVAKGREKDQVASLVTTRDRIPSIFDWEKMPDGLTREQVMKMIDTFYDRSDKNIYAATAGPFGFRGPAASHIPDHLTTIDKKTGLRTVQLIAPGYDCVSNDFINKAVKIMNIQGDPTGYLAITSANPSSNRYKDAEGNKPDIPAHFKLKGLQEEFAEGYEINFVFLGKKHPDEEKKVRDSYPYHVPNSTTIIDFSHSEMNVEGQPVVHLARHGSLSDDVTSLIVRALGMELIIDETAKSASELRVYPEDAEKRFDISTFYPSYVANC